MAVNPLTLESILIKAPTEAAAFAGGLAIHPALSPLLRDLENITWSLHPDKRLDLVLAAEVAAEDVAQYDAMATEAKQNGYDADRFKWAWGATLSAPGVGELITLLRRDAEVKIDFEHGLRKAKLEAQWDDALRNLRHARLSPQEIALGVVRSVIADPGLLVTTLDTSGGRVPAYPEWGGDALAEALTGGFDKERLRVLVGEIGLPMSAQQAASAYFRKIINLGDYNRAILEGDTRPEWAPFILEQARQILTASEYQEAALRGVLSPAEADAKTAQHGMSPADAKTLFEIMGRPLAVHQITQGLAHHVELGGTYDDVPEPYRDAIRRSNIRPEYAKLAYANRYTYPSAFVLRSLTQSHDITEQEAHDILLFEGWEPTLAAKVSASWAGGVTAKADSHVAKAETQLWTTTHASYKAGEIDDATVTVTLPAAGVAATAIPGVLDIWRAERALVRATLSAANIRTAYRKQDINDATGVAWTIEEAVAALMARGWSQADAHQYLEIG